jgi:hypothetical protein
VQSQEASSHAARPLWGGFLDAFAVVESPSPGHGEIQPDVQPRFSLLGCYSDICSAGAALLNESQPYASGAPPPPVPPYSCQGGGTPHNSINYCYLHPRATWHRPDSCQASTCFVPVIPSPSGKILFRFEPPYPELAFRSLP